MATLVFRTSGFELKMLNVEIEWDAGVKKLKFKLYNVLHHERTVIKAILNQGLLGTNALSYVVDVIIKEMDPQGEDIEMVFPRFSWAKMEDKDNWLWCEGWYRASDNGSY